MDMKLIFSIAAIILAFLSLILVYRICKGPSLVDRLLAADAIDILLGIIMILFGCIEGRALYLDLGLIVTLLGFVGTVLICKYEQEEL